LSPAGSAPRSANDVLLLRRTIAPTRRLLDKARAAGLCIIHTREGHRPTSPICRRRKKARGKLATGIGDPGPMGESGAREPGNDIITSSLRCRRPVVDMPGKGAFSATDLDAMLKNRGIAQADRVRGHHRGLRQHHRAARPMTAVRLRRRRRLRRLVFPGVSGDGLRMIKAQGGIFGWVASSEDVMAALPASVD